MFCQDSTSLRIIIIKRFVLLEGHDLASLQTAALWAHGSRDHGLIIREDGITKAIELIPRRFRDNDQLEIILGILVHGIDYISAAALIVAIRHFTHPHEHEKWNFHIMVDPKIGIEALLDGVMVVRDGLCIIHQVSSFGRMPEQLVEEQKRLIQLLVLVALGVGYQRGLANVHNRAVDHAL